MAMAHVSISVNGYRPLSEMSGRELEDAAYAIGVQRSLPKPPRVEKWQRWRDSKGVEFTVTGPREDVIGVDIYPLRKDGEDGLWRGSNLLGGKNWTFLGYAKPDKVEVGQMWREFGTEYTVIGVLAGAANLQSSAIGVSNEAMPCDTMIRLDRWAYRGMADGASVAEDAIHKCAIATGQMVGAVREAVNDIKMRFEIDPSWKAPSTQTSQTAEQAKHDARRANEEAAKRLIANPPEWAYPKAWMCAVLAMLEGTWKWLPERMTDTLDLYSQGRAEGWTHEKTKAAILGPGDEFEEATIEVYARGMERPSPLMGRQGIKRWISTCDLGAEYE